MDHYQGHLPPATCHLPSSTPSAQLVPLLQATSVSALALQLQQLQHLLPGKQLLHADQAKGWAGRLQQGLRRGRAAGVRACVVCVVCVGDEGGTWQPALLPPLPLRGSPHAASAAAGSAQTAGSRAAAAGPTCSAPSARPGARRLPLKPPSASTAAPGGPLATLTQWPPPSACSSNLQLQRGRWRGGLGRGPGRQRAAQGGEQRGAREGQGGQGGGAALMVRTAALRAHSTHRPPPSLPPPPSLTRGPAGRPAAARRAPWRGLPRPAGRRRR
jgi:hypothetical protein